jgi:ABC-type sugar transport system ATPase subunit
VPRINGSLIFHGGGGESWTVPVDARRTSGLAERAGRSVVLGLRPEHITPSAAPGAGRFDALLERVESTGSESLIYLSKGQGSFIARGPAAFSAPAGQNIALSFAMEEAHFFDAATGAALR